MSWNKHGGIGWRRVKGTRAEMRKTSNGWWQVREMGGASVAHSTRDGDAAWAYALDRYSLVRRDRCRLAADAR